jgi:hypothetical protein
MFPGTFASSKYTGLTQRNKTPRVGFQGYKMAIWEGIRDLLGFLSLCKFCLCPSFVRMYWSRMILSTKCFSILQDFLPGHVLENLGNK